MAMQIGIQIKMEMELKMELLLIQIHMQLSQGKGKLHKTKRLHAMQHYHAVLSVLKIKSMKL